MLLEALGETAASLSVSYMSAVVEMRQIIGRTRQQLDKDTCRRALGGKYSNGLTWQGQKLGNVVDQRAPTFSCLSPAVAGSVYSKQHFLLVAHRQKCLHPETATLKNSLHFFA